jgi:hypothetical protein|tara:strand:- start:4145 stop:4363 length:219 start_codon:yes stop_codon:yes gene_type:complete
MKKRRISIDSLEKKCREFADTEKTRRAKDNLPPMSNSERLEMMSLVAKSLELKYEIDEKTEEELKGEENGNN